MLELGIGGYTRQEVIDVLHGRSGSRGIVKFRCDLLNREEIRIGELAVESGNVRMDSLAEIKRTARFTITEQEAQDIDWLSDRIRPVFLLQMPDGGWIEWPLGIFMPSSPTRKSDGGRIVREVEAYDTSLILKEDKFTDRYIIPAGTKYVEAVADILYGVGIWKVNILDHPGVLSVDREFEIGTAKLTAINELLAAINYTSIWVDENGFLTSKPYQLPSDREAEYEYRTDDISIIHPGATEELDLFSVPNKWVRYVSNPDVGVVLRSEYTNDLSVSPTSTVRRGRVITDAEAVDDIADQETLDAYVRRIAYQASQVYGHLEFSTAVMPHHSFYDCLYIEHKGLGVSSKYMESSWELPLQADGAMTHSCRKVIRI